MNNTVIRTKNLAIQQVIQRQHAIINGKTTLGENEKFHKVDKAICEVIGEVRNQPKVC